MAFIKPLFHAGAPRRPRKDVEHQIQTACVNWFRLAHPKLGRLLFAVPNGGARSAATASMLKAEGVVSGVSDLLLLVPSAGFHGLCIEMKTPKGRQSESQKLWQTEAEEQGYCYALCRSLDDFIRTINFYLNN